MTTLRVAFDMLPLARWGPLFHVLRLERPEVRFQWRPTGFPIRGRSLLEGADVGVFVAPPPEPGLNAMTLDSSEMLVAMAVGHRLAHGAGITVADVLDEPFPGGPDLDAQWRAFWTLDAFRGGPPRLTDDRIANAEQGLEVVVSGRAIATVSSSIADGIAHPGVVAVPLLDGPRVVTCLVCRSDDDDPVVRSLVGLARDMRGSPGARERVAAVAGSGRNGALRRRGRA
jgi:DNA-binding transcriptional LysR family regulator